MKWIHKILGLFLVKPFFKIFFRLKVEGKENLKNLSGPLLIIGNHKFFLDPFALGAATPISTNIHPIRIMGEIAVFNHPGLRLLKKTGIIKLVYSLFGVFSAVRGVELKEALEAPINILKNNGIVFLFPEGKIVHEDEIGQFKRGAPALALITKTKILPIALKIGHKGVRKKYFVKFGQVFSLPEGLTNEDGSGYMRSIIEDLYRTLK